MKWFYFFLFLTLNSFLYEDKATYKVVMIVNLFRHGARTPTKMRPEFKKYFRDTQTGKLTVNGFRQMTILGKVLREKYINSKNPHLKDFFDLNKINEQFVLVSSPYVRAIESGLGYVLGLFPEF